MMNSFVDVIRPSNKPMNYAFQILCILSGSLFLALLSQISIPLGFTPVPLSMQTFGVLLLGALLGSKKGTMAVLAYLCEGALGLPVFAGGTSGAMVFFGPTGGYLVGFVCAVFAIGYLLERGWKYKISLTLIALTLGSCITLFYGALWLSCFVGLKQAFFLGIYPFLIGDVIKIVAAAFLIPSGWKAVSYFNQRADAE